MALALMVVPAVPAIAGDLGEPDIDVETAPGGLFGDGTVGVEPDRIPGTSRATSEVASSSSKGPTKYIEHRWSAMCASGEASPRSPQAGDSCGIARQCQGGTLAGLWQREVVINDGRYLREGPWVEVGPQCVSFDPENPPENLEVPPLITPGMVLRELQRVGLPELQIRVQPAEKTLVNFETIFYAEPEPYQGQLTLLGQEVDVRAEPSTFDWTFGDGETMQTTEPGAPYPDKTIVHEYVDAEVTVRPSVDVTYTAEFRVNGGPWQDVGDTVTIPGPPTGLRITEATPVLTGTD